MEKNNDLAFDVKNLINNLEYLERINNVIVQNTE